MDHNKTIEQLENDFWGPPEYHSHLVTTCHRLRKKPIKDFNIEDLRIMIGQNIGLEYLVPKAIDALKENLLVSGDLFDGDLLLSVLRVEESYWDENPSHKDQLIQIVNKDLHRIEKEITNRNVNGQLLSLIEKLTKKE